MTQTPTPAPESAPESARPTVSVFDPLTGDYTGERELAPLPEWMRGEPR